LREGQWLAIAGLIQDEQEASKVRVPLLGDIPIVDTLFSRKSVVRDETELIILVSPELVHPLDPQEAPLILPGMEVTEPSDFHFFIYGDIERWPPYHHRSTVWPVEQRKAIEAHHHAVREAKMHRHYQRSECYYLQGDHGFSR
jgi:pilus assembly protein CpaC